jgi:hypothetical protein
MFIIQRENELHSSFFVRKEKGLDQWTVYFDNKHTFSGDTSKLFVLQKRENFGNEEARPFVYSR